MSTETTEMGDEVQPFRCPVCGGNGLVSGGFYTQTSGVWSAATVRFEICKSCNGTGVIWRELIKVNI